MSIISMFERGRQIGNPVGLWLSSGFSPHSDNTTLKQCMFLFLIAINLTINTSQNSRVMQHPVTDFRRLIIKIPCINSRGMCRLPIVLDVMLWMYNCSTRGCTDLVIGRIRIIDPFHQGLLKSAKSSNMDTNIPWNACHFSIWLSPNHSLRVDPNWLLQYEAFTKGYVLS